MRRYCKTCQTSHEKPTGKGCRKQTEMSDQESDIAHNKDNQILEALQDIKLQIHGVQERVGNLEAKQTTDFITTGATAAQMDPTPLQQQGEQRATPHSVRQSEATMAEVAAKLREWGLHDEGDYDGQMTSHPWRARIKKSGTVSTATDEVKVAIDWPHYHVQKGPDRAAPEYKHLSSEEFVLGFLRMLRSPENSFDNARMLEILQEVMEDAVDFGWERARAFYGMIGRQVEHKRLAWTDTNELLKLRLTHSRTVLPQQQSKQMKPGPKTPIKPCTPFQSGSCDQTSDHGQFKHVCDYCHRVRNLTFHHPESDCRTKRADAAKNS